MTHPTASRAIGRPRYAHGLRPRRARTARRTGGRPRRSADRRAARRVGLHVEGGRRPSRSPGRRDRQPECLGCSSTDGRPAGVDGQRADSCRPARRPSSSRRTTGRPSAGPRAASSSCREQGVEERAAAGRSEQRPRRCSPAARERASCSGKHRQERPVDHRCNRPSRTPGAHPGPTTAQPMPHASKTVAPGSGAVGVRTDDHVVRGEHPAAAAEVRAPRSRAAGRPSPTDCEPACRRGGGVRRGHRHGVLSRHGDVSAGCARPASRAWSRRPRACGGGLLERCVPIVRRSSRSSTDQPALQYEKRPGACTSGSAATRSTKSSIGSSFSGSRLGLPLVCDSSVRGVSGQRPSPCAAQGASRCEVAVASGVQDATSPVQRLGDGAGIGTPCRRPPVGRRRWSQDARA